MEHRDIKVEVEDEHIVVSMEGTSLVLLISNPQTSRG